MNPEWILAIIGAVQAIVLALQWRTQRDQARERNELREWIHREYMPRELAEALYLHKPDSGGFSAFSQQLKAKS